MALNQSDQQPLLDTQNAYRSDPTVKAQNLVWDATLAAGAQSWADTLAANNAASHSSTSSRPDVGENIAWGSKGAATPAQLADTWGTGEKPNFKPGIFPNVNLYPNDPTKTVPRGHFEQATGLFSHVGLLIMITAVLQFLALLCTQHQGPQFRHRWFLPSSSGVVRTKYTLLIF